MSYRNKINLFNLWFSVGNGFPDSPYISFDFSDDEFIEAVKNQDERIWQVLRWATSGEGRKYHDAMNFEEIVEANMHRISSDDLCFLDEQEKYILNLLNHNEYISQNSRNALLECLEDIKANRRIIENKQKRENKKITNSRQGYVYLIKLENGLCKIGKAINVNTRIKPFSVNFPMTWELLHFFKSNDYSLAESNLHKKYSDKRKIGEFFLLQPDDIEYIKNIKDFQL